MEVHTHTHTALDPDSHRGRKKWTHYLWEFIMLFLAVYCGFLAENLREHKIENTREKQYIRSMIEDLETDMANLQKVIRGFSRNDSKYDTAIAFFPGITNGYNDTLWRTLPKGFPDFVKADRTMQQLKNSGGMRLVKNKKAADGITDYDLKCRNLDIDVNSLIGVHERYYISYSELIDHMALDADKKMMNPKELESGRKNYLLKSDKPSLGKFYNQIKLLKELAGFVKSQEEKLLDKAVNLIELLKKEYHLE